MERDILTPKRRDRCVSCGYNGDGHYTHCLEPYREEAKKLWNRLEADNYKGHDAELLDFVRKVAGIYH